MLLVRITPKRPIFPALLSRVRARDFLEHALGMPDNSCVEVYLEDNKVHVSEPLKDNTMIDLGTHIGFLHSCRVDDCPIYRTREDGLIEVDMSEHGDMEGPEKGYFFDKCRTVSKEDIEEIIAIMLEHDNYHEAHVLMNRLCHYKDMIGVPPEPDIVSKGSQSIYTISAPDLLHYAMTIEKGDDERSESIYLDPENMHVGTIGLGPDDTVAGLTKSTDLVTVILKRIEDEKNSVTSGKTIDYFIGREKSLRQLSDTELLRELNRIKRDLSYELLDRKLLYRKKFHLGYIRACTVDDWTGFRMLDSDHVHHNGMNLTLGQAYKEICKLNPDSDVNRLMKIIEPIRQAFKNPDH